MQMLGTAAGEVDDVGPVELRHNTGILGIFAADNIQAVCGCAQAGEVAHAVARGESGVFKGSGRWYDGDAGVRLSGRLKDVTIHARAGRPELVTPDQQDPLRHFCAPPFPT